MTDYEARTNSTSPVQPIYRLQAGEPGIFCELYLPKRTEYQLLLYTALTDGFSIDRVRAHLSKERVRQRIRRLFRDYGRDTLRIVPIKRDFDPMYRGYSIYEVDGVFKDKRSRYPFEEKTQIVRIMFRLDSRSSCRRFGLTEKEVQRIGRIFFRNQSSYTKVVAYHYRMQHKNGARLSTAEQKLLNYLANVWHNHVTLFVFGYLVFRISDGIGRLYGRRKIQQFEREIWVTQFWNVNINRIITDP